MEFAPFLLLDTEHILADLRYECQKRRISTDDVVCFLESHRIHFSDPNIPSHAILDDKFYHSSGFTIRQTCDILVRPKLTQNTFSLYLSPNKDEAFIRCHESFLIFDEMRQELSAQVCAELAILGVILRDMDSLNARLNTLLHTIKRDPKMRSKTFCLMKSSIFTPKKPPRLHFIPQERYNNTQKAHKHKEQHGGAFFDDEILPPPPRMQEAFYGINAGDLLAIHELGDSGVSGRNLLGQYIASKSGQEQVAPIEQEFITYTIHPNKIEYFSDVQGYVALHNQYTAPYAMNIEAHHVKELYSEQSLQEQMLADDEEFLHEYVSGGLEQGIAWAKEQHRTQAPIARNNHTYTAKSIASTHTSPTLFCFYFPPKQPLKSTSTPPLLGGVSAKIALHIHSHDSSDDALSDGMYIEAERIEINGNIGSQAVIKARQLVINGATHKHSYILAQNAKILTHRGLLIAQQCVIKNVDSGKIYADSIQVQESIASIMYAKSISIERVRSANQCHFSTQLYIKEIPKTRSDNNAFFFDLLGSSAYRDYLYHARIYHQKHSITLEETQETLLALLTKFNDAKRFLQKLQGFTPKQQELALQNIQFAKKHQESLIIIKLYQMLQSRKQTLSNHLNTLLHTTIPMLQDRLANARLYIGHVGGFENYVHIQEISLDATHNALETLLLSYNQRARIVIAKDNATSTMQEDMHDIPQESTDKARDAKHPTSIPHAPRTAINPSASNTLQTSSIAPPSSHTTSITPPASFTPPTSSAIAPIEPTPINQASLIHLKVIS